MRRRDFIKQSCGACAAISIGMMFGSSLLSSCGTTKLTVAKAVNKNGKALLPLLDFKEDELKLVRVNDYPFDIAVKKEGSIFIALVMMCTHAGHPLLKSGDGFYCTLHGSHFNSDGTVATGPASKSLMHLPTAINNDFLEITLLKPIF